MPSVIPAARPVEPVDQMRRTLSGTVSAIPAGTVIGIAPAEVTSVCCSGVTRTVIAADDPL